MNVLEELRALDVNEPGRWPLPFRAAAVFIILVIVTALGIWRFVIRTEIPELEAKEQQEQELRASFENKQSLAANFDAYRDQLDAIERDFGTMLRKLPGETEVENLLEDISQTALGAGLEEKLFNPQAEVRKDFYAELPITVRYVGSYHEIAKFISDVAALPRIVTLHDIRITPISVEGDQEQLQLDATAKTYRYLEEESPE
jgi:type IV pilus assembly protein PilO